MILNINDTEYQFFKNINNSVKSLVQNMMKFISIQDNL